MKKDTWDGLPLRAIPGRKMKNYRGWWTHFWDLLPCALSEKKRQGASYRDLIEISRFLRQTKASPLQFAVGMNKVRRTFENADMVDGILASGQVVGRINDIPTCHEIIERTNNEAEQVIKILNGRLT